jgi:ABC-type multidrug transport system fused ATPase/permease subunit
MGSVFFWLALCAVFLGSQGLQIEVNLWIRRWAANYDPQVESTTVLSLVLAPVAQTLLALSSARLADDKPVGQALAATGRDDSTTFYLSWYVILSVIYLISIALRMGYLFWGSLRASASLYDDLLRRVLGARVRFFDSTPTGRILNRFGKVVDSPDARMPGLADPFLLLTSRPGYRQHRPRSGADLHVPPDEHPLVHRTSDRDRGSSGLPLLTLPTIMLASQAVVVVISAATPLFIVGAAFIIWCGHDEGGPDWVVFSR